MSSLYLSANQPPRIRTKRAFFVPFAFSPTASIIGSMGDFWEAASLVLRQATWRRRTWFSQFRLATVTTLFNYL